jgi:dUTP pyrophosphatase
VGSKYGFEGGCVMLYGYDTTESICAELSEENRKLKEGKRMDKVKVVLDEGAVMPTRGHATDAGLDLYAREDKVIPGKGSAVFDTGVHIALPEGTVGFLKSKSGLNVRFGTLSEGVIDSGFTGAIVAKLYNHSEECYRVKKGDKITQLVILPILTPELEVVDSLDETERGDGGFGSTGR